ncbi:DUF3108 domain-containing protein [Candidatus Nitrotoga arctica]|uniref:DUF3108 domain-containing protein n=1 Tax=Candidatus Nitrotoga arctica TaxID=453162 RepID=A0ABM8YVV9_9PROT|nr:DUF3108 domain-containing protein [Candidatus Nitrotoga arctica]CAG9931594.1 conserved exported protein of unknown function [Candidatus Nitrotoga arctica]
MRNIIYLAGLLLLVSIAPQALFAATPASPVQFTTVDAHYDVLKGNIKVATISETYTRTQGGYHIESVTKAIGLLAMFKAEVIRVTSEGTLTSKGLRPLTYIQERKLDTERNTRADFDWKTKHITLTDRAGKRTLPLPAGTQDRLSAMYQFMFAPLQNATELNFNMTNGSKVDEYSYRITPDQNMTIPLGTFKALYVASPPQDGENQTEIWLATEHGNFPYKMIITESGGDKFMQVLTQINFE